jgi:hypothetical protein
MRSVYERQSAEQIEINGRGMRGEGVFVRTTKFHDVCKKLWPHEKLDAFLAAHAKRDPRTARRWLDGEFEPPISIVKLVMGEIFPDR